jgi:hypothetical protein
MIYLPLKPAKGNPAGQKPSDSSALEAVLKLAQTLEPAAVASHVILEYHHRRAMPFRSRARL